MRENEGERETENDREGAVRTTRGSERIAERKRERDKEGENDNIRGREKRLPQRAREVKTFSLRIHGVY